MNGLTTFQRDKSDYQAKILICKFPHGGKKEEEMGPLWTTNLKQNAALKKTDMPTKRHG